MNGRRTCFRKSWSVPYYQHSKISRLQMTKVIAWCAAAFGYLLIGGWCLSYVLGAYDPVSDGIRLLALALTFVPFLALLLTAYSTYQKQRKNRSLALEKIQ